MAVAPPAAADAGLRIDNSRTRLAENFETFLTLLTAQLKNQDPLSPMDGNQFTEQLVQMSGVEQQLLTNDLLKTLVGQASGGPFSGALDMIGREVTAEGAEATLGADGAVWVYDIPSGAASTTLEVTDAAGKVVWSGQAPDPRSGRYVLEWDGLTSSGEQAPQGVYALTVKGMSADGRAMQGKTFLRGVVTGVEQVDGTTMLTVGRLQIPMDQVSGVRVAG